MSPVRSAVALLAIAILAIAATFAGDLGAGSLASREVMVLVALTIAFLAVQALFVARSRANAGSAVLIVRDGLVTSARKELPGRAVSLLVQSGQAVVTENLGRYSRVLPPGLASLKPGESIFKIISTQPRTLSGTVDCTSREGIPVSVDFEVTAQITASPAETDAASGAAQDAQRSKSPATKGTIRPWSKAAVVRAAYETHNWEAAVLSETRAVLRDLVVQTCLDALSIPVPGSGGARRGLEELQERAQPRITAAARGWGLSVTSVRVHGLRLPSEVTATLLRSWNAMGAAAGHAPDAGAAATAGEPSALLVAPVLERGQFSTLRQALRQPSALVRVVTAGVDGRTFSIGAHDGGALELRLRQDRAYFALRVQGASLRDLGLADGDYVIFEDGAEAADGDVVAAAWEGRVALWRYWKRADHVLLAPELATRSAVALVSTMKIAPGIRERYLAQHPPVHLHLESEVKVLGRAVAALRESRESGSVPAARRSVENADVTLPRAIEHNDGAESCEQPEM